LTVLQEAEVKSTEEIGLSQRLYKVQQKDSEKPEWPTNMTTRDGLAESRRKLQKHKR